MSILLIVAIAWLALQLPVAVVVGRTLARGNATEPTPVVGYSLVPDGLRVP